MISVLYEYRHCICYTKRRTMCVCKYNKRQYIIAKIGCIVFIDPSIILQPKSIPNLQYIYINNVSNKYFCQHKCTIHKQDHYKQTVRHATNLEI